MSMKARTFKSNERVIVKANGATETVAKRTRADIQAEAEERREQQQKAKAQQARIDESLPVSIKACLEADTDIVCRTENKEWTRSRIAYRAMYAKGTEALREVYKSAWHETYKEELFQEAMMLLCDGEEVAYASERALKYFITEEGLDKLSALDEGELANKVAVKAYFRTARTAMRRYTIRNRMNPFTNNTRTVYENGDAVEDMTAPISTYEEEGTLIKVYPYMGAEVTEYREGAFMLTESPVYVGSGSDKYFASTEDDIAVLDSMTDSMTTTIENNIDYVLSMIDIDIKAHLAVKDWETAHALVEGKTTLRDISPRPRKRIASVVKQSLKEIELIEAM